MKALTEGINLFYCYKYFNSILNRIDEYNDDIKNTYDKIGGITLMPRLKIGINHVAIGKETLKVLIKKYYDMKNWKFDTHRYKESED